MLAGYHRVPNNAVLSLMLPCQHGEGKETCKRKKAKKERKERKKHSKHGVSEEVIVVLLCAHACMYACMHVCTISMFFTVVHWEGGIGVEMWQPHR